ncbi:MAG TPA: isoprenylcysteine carboxylmethyltransferase family protein [Acidobacteriota bacterium]|nr:isoprenylcysteine carboxylmethyltransferase family protein [Acidobacteriota bacterium]
MKLNELVGSGDKIALLTLPFLAIGLVLNILFPGLFEVGGPSAALKVIAFVLLILGVIIWAWSVVLILMKVPRRELITTGPFAVVKHPLYTGVALLVAPAVGFLLNSWLGIPVGTVMYIGSRRFSPEEEKALARAFGAAWDEYANNVLIPWV